MADISIIVPIYNAEKFIKKCVDSLLNQTKKELEFILINDGSTDKTHDILKTYKDKRIKYFKNKNQGIGKTRNFGIEKATGKYIIFIDSDDYIEPTTCEELYNKAIKEKADVVVCDFFKVYDDGSIEDINLPSFKTSKLKDNPNILIDINLSPWNKIYSTKLIKDNNIRFAEGIKYEDVPFVSEALDRANKIAKLDKKLNYYVIHGNSETTVRDKRIFDILKIVDMIRKYFKNKTYMNDIVDKLTVRIVTNYNIQQRQQKDIKVGMEFIDDAFAYLKKEVPDYKDNKYYENRSFLKRTIEKNKLFSKLYCRLYHMIKKS
ncbi:MAG: glycosyltransferase [Bacilli bacterium]|nr:glycosyltransferase [Bacilli bacterium]